MENLAADAIISNHQTQAAKGTADAVNQQ